MFIKQLESNKLKLWLYLPFSIGFLGFIFINLLGASAQGNSTKILIQQMIEKIGKLPTFIMMVLPLSILCLCLLFWVKVIQKQSIRSLTTARKSIDFKRIGFSFLVWSGISIFISLVTYVLNPSDYKIIFKLSDFLPFLLASLILIPLQTSFEEYFFRGFLMQGLGLKFQSKVFPLIITSFLFGWVHGANPEVENFGAIMYVYYIGTGLFLGIITLLDDGLELALGFHAANNIIASLLVSSPSAVFQTDAILEEIQQQSNTAIVVQLCLQVFLIFPLLIYFFSKKYNWKVSVDKILKY